MSYGNSDVIPLMYHLMGAMASLGYPIVFKGAMVLNALKLPVDTARMTQDIDGDWVSPEITNERLLDSLNYALTSLGNTGLHVEQTRTFAQGRSAGFVVKRRQDDFTLFTLDIGVKGNNFYVPYTKGNVTFYGSHPNKIYADKVSAISTNKVYIRTKDIYDMYLLSFLNITFSTRDIVEVLFSSDKTLGDFSSFLNDTKPKGIEYAYNKLDGITNKPDFASVHKRVATFIKPFILTNTPPNGFWEVNSQTGQGSWTFI